MPKFLLWNLKRSASEDLAITVARLAIQHEIDYLLLLEARQLPAGKMLEILKGRGDFSEFVDWLEATGIEPPARFFAALPSTEVVPVRSQARMHIRLVQPKGKQPFLLALVHLVDKGSEQSADQQMYLPGLSRVIAEMEDRHSIKATIVAGDFNINPFETGMLNPAGFNAVPTRREALGVLRRKQAEEYRYFYNPMWSMFGDLHGPPGTYYYSSSSLRWNMFDQFLLRPELVKHFVKVEILDAWEEDRLVSKNGIPNQRYSDHLPVVLTLSEAEVIKA